MFFRRDKPSSDPPAERAATPAAAGVSADDALDLAADLLRTYGENAFDRDLCENAAKQSGAVVDAAMPSALDAMAQ